LESKASAVILNHNIMGFIKEQEGVDFVIKSKSATKKQEKELNE